MQVPQDVAGSVGRAVVAGEDFEFEAGLDGDHGAQQALDGGPLVVDRHQHAQAAQRRGLGNHAAVLVLRSVGGPGAAVVSEDAEEEERVVPVHVHAGAVDLPELTRDAHRRHQRRQLSRRAIPAEPGTGKHEHHRGCEHRTAHRYARHEFVAHDGAQAAPPAPESERTLPVRVGALVVADRVVDHGTEDAAPRQRARAQEDRTADDQPPPAPCRR